MGINMPLAISQAKMISDHASQLRGVLNKLHHYKSDLNTFWKATEMQYINLAIDRINSELSNLVSELNTLSADITSTAHEIRREEEAREAAAREAARQAAARQAAFMKSFINK